MTQLTALCGVPTYHTRVEPWECDHNNHWNTRFYGRSFDIGCSTLLAEQSILLANKENYKQGLVRHLSFHKELFLSSVIEVQSARIAEPFEESQALLHVLYKKDQMSATAIDYWMSAKEDVDVDALTLPAVELQNFPKAMPRTINIPLEYIHKQQFYDKCCTIIGVERGDNTDGFGYLNSEEVLRCVGISNSRFMEQVGFGLEQQRETQLGLMAVECRMAWHAPISNGQLIKVYASISYMSEKSFTLNHYFMLPDGRLFLSVEIAQLCVDLQQRKVVKLPSLLHDVI